jgi:hypothetical protein
VQFRGLNLMHFSVKTLIGDDLKPVSLEHVRDNPRVSC